MPHENGKAAHLGGGDGLQLQDRLGEQIEPRCTSTDDPVQADRFRRREVSIELELAIPSSWARPIDSAHVAALADSFLESGVLRLPQVRAAGKMLNGKETESYEVMAGLHAIEAARLLDWSTMRVMYWSDIDDLHAELISIDENYIRRDLSPSLRASNSTRRAQIYEKIYPSAKAGAKRAAGMNRALNRGGDVAANSAATTALRDAWQAARPDVRQHFIEARGVPSAFAWAASREKSHE